MIHFRATATISICEDQWPGDDPGAGIVLHLLLCSHAGPGNRAPTRHLSSSHEASTANRWNLICLLAEEVPRPLPRLLVVLHNQDPISKGNTYTTHWTWRVWVNERWRTVPHSDTMATSWVSLTFTSSWRKGIIFLPVWLEICFSGQNLQETHQIGLSSCRNFQNPGPQLCVHTDWGVWGQHK